MRSQLLKLKLKAEHGFTTVVVMGMLLIGMLLVAAAFAATDNDTQVARHDQYYKEAYNAAEAGLNWYFYHLTQDANYWQSCTTGPVNTAGTAWASMSKNNIPGSEAQYALELLPATLGGTCVSTNGASIINPTTGTFRVRSTGNYRGVRRTVIGTFKRTSFLNFIWFTDYETNDPVVPRANLNATQVAAQCTKHNWPGTGGTPPNDTSPRSSNCEDPAFITGDTLAGPVRSNDEFLVCGNPTFGRSGKNDLIQTQSPNFYRACDTSGNNPTINTTPLKNQTGLVMPPDNASLKTHADCVLTGPTHITLGLTSMTIMNNGTNVTTSCPYTNGVIYIQNGTCSNDFVTSEKYPSGSGCGDAWVHSDPSTDAGQDVTIAADNDIIIDGNIKRASASNAAIGLIANNFVRVFHPARNNSGCTSNFTPSTGEGAGRAPLSNPEIDAAILSLKHSFIVDNWNCGAPLGTLKVVGAIAQEYRGTVGTFNSSGIQSGYLKNYTYDDALRYHDPPFFLDPVQAGWDIQSETEQVPSH
jgi:hypothetical protein